jgi:hypothetical protein
MAGRTVCISQRGTLPNTVCRLAERGVFSPKVGKVHPLKEGAVTHRLQ